MKKYAFIRFLSIKNCDKIFSRRKKYEKISSIFQCNWQNTNIGRKPCKWLDVYFSGKEPNFYVKYRFEKGTPFQKQVRHLLENIAFGKTSCYVDIACSLARQMGKQNVCPSSWCKPNLHNCSIPQSCWQNRQTGRLWWGNRKQKATTIA